MREVERALAVVPGVLSVEVNLATETARVQTAGADLPALIAALRRAGYDATPLVQASSHDPTEDRRTQAARRDHLHLLAAAILTLPLVLPGIAPGLYLLSLQVSETRLVARIAKE